MLRRGELSEFDVDVVFLGQPPEVDDGVAHTAEGGVDAHAGALGDVLEVALSIVAEDDDASLLGREHFHKFADVAVGLLAHEQLFDVVVVEFEGVDDVAVGTVGHDGHTVVSPVVVHDEVVGDSHHPMDKLVFFLVAARIDGGDDFEEGVLKNIVCHVLVLDHREDVAVHLGLVALEQDIETGTVALFVPLNQLVVR